MPEKYDPEQVERLIGSVNENTATMHTLQSDVSKASAVGYRAQDSAEDAKRLVRAGAGILVLVTILMFFGIGYALSAKHTADAANRDRAERTATACVYSNNNIFVLRQALVASLVALIPENQILSPEQEASLTRYRNVVDKALPYRKCTPEGIKAYFDNPPADPGRGGN